MARRLRNSLVVGGIVLDVAIEGLGVETSFERFYASQRQSAARLAWLLTHDRSVAEDVAQDAFAGMFSRFEALDRPEAYLRRSIVNGVYQRTRRAGRERIRLRRVAAGAVSHVEGPTGGLADVVARLPLKERTAVVLRYWAGMTDDQIADAMDIRPGSVRSLLSRATVRLRQEITR